MNMKEKITDLIRNRSTNMPTLPVVINNIIVCARSNRSSAAELGRYISNDQALVSRILKIANSPYYGSPKRIDSITRAIIVVGFKEIISIALGSGVFSVLSKKSTKTSIDMNQLWMHSIGVGFAAKNIELYIGRQTDESTMLTGLLHDIGKIVFFVYFPEEYSKVLEAEDINTGPLHLVEKKVLGLDHAEMASLIMKHWNFPDIISIPISYHHEHESCPRDHLDMCMIINAANYICHISEIGHSGNQSTEKTEEAFSALGLNNEDIGSLVENLKSEQEEIEGFLQALR